MYIVISFLAAFVTFLISGLLIYFIFLKPSGVTFYEFLGYHDKSFIIKFCFIFVDLTFCFYFLFFSN